MIACCSLVTFGPASPCAVGICTPNMPEVHHHHGWNAHGELVTMPGPAVPDEDWAPEHEIAGLAVRTQEHGPLV